MNSNPCKADMFPLEPILLGKAWTPLSLSYRLFFCKICFGIKKSMKVAMPFNKNRKRKFSFFFFIQFSCFPFFFFYILSRRFPIFGIPTLLLFCVILRSFFLHHFRTAEILFLWTTIILEIFFVACQCDIIPSEKNKQIKLINKHS